VIIEDYAKGLIDREAGYAGRTEAKAHGKIVAIDSQSEQPVDWSVRHVLQASIPAGNFLTTGLPYSQDEAEVLKARPFVQKTHAISAFLLITLSEAGMLLVEQGQKPYHSRRRARRMSCDVSGAATRPSRTFTLALAAGATASRGGGDRQSRGGSGSSASSARPR